MKINRYLSLVLLFCFTTYQISAQCLIPHSSLDHRIQNADLIVEGKIIHKTAFWGKDIDIIFTKYEIEVYKIFRGNPSLTTVHFIEQGGILGDEMTKVDPSLEKEIGAMGVFMLKELNHHSILDASEKQYYPYDAFASMINYDLIDKSATDVFEGKLASKTALYKKIEKQTGEAVLVKALPAPPAPGLMMDPVISSFSPTTAAAGVGIEFTITGTGFGTTPGSVVFPDADNGGAGGITVSAISWTDNEIVTQVVSRAGTGQIRVITSDNVLSDPSSQTLTVPYNITNIASGTIGNMVDDACEGDGGYKISYSSSTANGGLNFLTAANSSGDASSAFERAIQTWQGQAGYAIYAGVDCGTTTIQSPANDGVNVVGFANNNLDLGNAIGRAYSQYTGCNGSPFELSGIDIFFAQLNNWYYGENAGGIVNGQTDFESVAVHEIGHTHQLGHIINPGAVMHFQILSGTTERSLSTGSDIAGAAVVANQAINYTPLNCSANCSYTNYNASEDCGLLSGAPVELTLFDARAQEKTTLLTWETASELNNDFFRLEHSLDGINYIPLAEIRGAGSTQATTSYRYVHTTPDAGDNYYRLSQTDFDGTYEMLGVKIVRFKTDNIKIGIQPNPVNLDYLQMAYSSPEKTEIKTIIYSTDGKIIQQQTMAIGEGFNQITIPVQQLSNGVYVLQTIQNETIKTVRFVKN